MQLYLSNLVDLALGKPHTVDCESYNFLHALLHVMLRKLNIADSRIELTTELATKAQRIVNTLPRDPSLCFREYTLRTGGGKLRKKSIAVLGPKKSLILINRKWPHCCHSSSSSSSSSTASSSTTNSCDSGSVKPTRALKEIDDGASNLCASLSQRLALLEVEQQKQMEINRAAMQEFQKLRSDCEEMTRDLRKSSSLEIQSKSIAKFTESDKLQTDDVSSEIRWLKERMLEISESLKLHGDCLRKLKCEELPKIKSTQEELHNSMHTIKFQLLQSMEAAKAAKINESKCEIESIKSQVLCVSSRICEVEKGLEVCRVSTSSEMVALRNDFVDKIRDQLSVVNLECDEKSRLSNNSSRHTVCGFAEGEPQQQQQLSRQESNHSCVCPTITSSIVDIKKQVSSQSVCMQQLLRDLTMKLDRCEFQVYCHELNDTIDSLMQLKNDMFAIPTAAGGSIPLLTKVNCISCQATTNMKITASTVPRLRPVRGYPGCINQRNRGISDANWSCYNQKSGERRLRGASRCVSRKCRRAKTPFRPCGSPIYIYKNRFRKQACC